MSRLAKAFLDMLWVWAKVLGSIGLLTVLAALVYRMVTAIWTFIV